MRSDVNTEYLTGMGIGLIIKGSLVNDTEANWNSSSNAHFNLFSRIQNVQVGSWKVMERIQCRHKTEKS